MTTLLQDTFTDTAFTALEDHTMTVGGGWTEQTGSWSIDVGGTNATQTDSGGANYFITADSGVSDCTQSLDITIPGSGNYAYGLIVRYQDLNNYILAIVEADGGTPYVIIIKKAAGSQTTIGPSQNVTLSAGVHSLSVTTSGNSIAATINSVTANATDSFLSTTTLTGMMAYVDGTYPTTVFDNYLVDGAAPPSSSIAVAPTHIPKNHSNNITLALTGTGTAWDGTTTFTPSGVTGVTKISQNVTSGTAATVVITTDATHTGTLTITESVTGSATGTTTVATATISPSPSSGNTGGTPTVTFAGTNTVWTQETAAGLFTLSGGTGASIGTPTVTTDTSATATVTCGSAIATLTITDTSTGATCSFNVARTTPATFYIDPAGDDSHAGTSTGTAWQTMSKANSGPTGGYIAGDSLLFKGGSSFTGNLVWTTSGTQSARCTIGSYGSGLATIEGGIDIIVYVHNAEFVTVENLILSGDGTGFVDFDPGTGGWDPLIYSTGIHIHDSRTTGSKLNAVYVEGCEVSGVQFGIFLSTPNHGQDIVGFSDARFIDCDIHDCLCDGTITLGGDSDSDGFTFAGFGITNTKLTFLGLLIQNCNVHDISGTGQSAIGINVINATGVLIERCITSNIAYDDEVNAFSFSSASYQFIEVDRGVIRWCEAATNATNIPLDGTGIDIDLECTNCVVEYCYAHDNNGPGFACFSNVSSNVLRHCVSRNDCQEVAIAAILNFGVVHNCTVFMDSSCTALASATQVNSPKSTAYYDNIFSLDSGRQVTTGNGTFLFVGNDYYWGGGTQNYDGSISTLSAWRGASQETLNGVAYGVVGDPALSAPTTAGNFLPDAQVGTCTYFDIGSGSAARGLGIPLELIPLVASPVDFHGYPARTGDSVDAGAVAYGASSLVPGFGAGGSGVSGSRIFGGF